MDLQLPRMIGQDQIRSRLRGITTHDADIDDMIQHAELRKTELQRKNNWPETGSVFESKKLYLIGRNFHFTKQRKKRRELPLEAALAANPTLASTKTESPDCDAMKKELRESVRMAVQSLALSDRQLIERHYFHGLSIQEAALAIGISESAAKTRLHRARKELRERL